MFDTKLNYETRFFTAGQELSGIESVTIGYSQQPSIIKPLGSSQGATVINGETQKNLSISRNLIYADPLLAYTGNLVLDASINYENDSYGFKSGYMTSYMVNCAIGAIPKVTTNFIIYDNLVKSANSAGSKVHPEIHIPNQGSMSIQCDNYTSNRVVGFDYTIKNSFKPLYTIGSILPVRIEFLSPVEYTASIQIEVDDAFLQNSSNFLTSRQNKTVSMLINGRDNITLQSLSIPNASLVSEQLSASSDGVLKLTLNYIGHS
jgi:hypothetical protein